MSVRFSRLALAQTSRAFAEAVRCLSDFLTYEENRSRDMDRNLFWSALSPRPCVGDPLPRETPPR
jgi:hypothetical protein